MSDGRIVCDTGPLIALALVDQLPVLQALYAEVLVPPAVLAEVTAGGPKSPGAKIITEVDWFSDFEEQTPIPLLDSQLGAGETSVIETAYGLGADCVLLDERRARSIAADYGLTVRGSAAILVAAKRAGLVPEVQPLLRSMTEQGYYLSERLIDKAASAAGE